MVLTVSGLDIQVDTGGVNFQFPTANFQLPKCLGVKVAANFTRMVRATRTWELGVGSFGS